MFRRCVMLVFIAALVCSTVAPTHQSLQVATIEAASLFSAPTVCSDGIPRSVYDTQRSSKAASEVEKSNLFQAAAALVRLPTLCMSKSVVAAHGNGLISSTLQANHVCLQV